jgi:hypothetical protein
MVMKRLAGFLCALAIISQSSVAFGVLTPAGGAGSGVGFMEHAYGPVGGMVVPGPAPANFNGFYAPNAFPLGDPTLPGTSGGMQAPGFNFPAFPAVPWPAVGENDTGNFGMVANTVYPLATAPTAIGPGFGGATTSMVGVGGGGRAGVAANFTLGDITALDAPVLVSTNTFGAMVVYDSVGGTNAQFGHWLAANAVVPPDGSGFVLAGVKSIFEIGFHNPATGVFTLPAAPGIWVWEPLPVLFTFDGDGVGLVDAIQADFFAVNALAGSASFGALSITPPAVIPAGMSVRMRGTITLVADPADIQMLPLDLFPSVASQIGPDFLGMGASTDAALHLNNVPEAGAAVLVGAVSLVSAGVGWAYRRRLGGKRLDIAA